MHSVEARFDTVEKAGVGSAESPPPRIHIAEHAFGSPEVQQQQHSGIQYSGSGSEQPGRGGHPAAMGICERDTVHGIRFDKHGAGRAHGAGHAHEAGQPHCMGLSFVGPHGPQVASNSVSLSDSASAFGRAYPYEQR